MNIIRLMGGIGNQFFQYAFGRVFENKGIKVAYDLSWFGQYTESSPSIKFPRIYRMDKFRVNIGFSHRIPSFRLVVGGGEEYNPKIFELDNCNFEGYWQQLRYYEGILPSLQGELFLKDEVKTTRFAQYKDEITKSESIGIHIRRGDYVGLWPVMSREYYINLINIIPGDVFVFSDDMGWCRQAFRDINRKTVFVDLPDYLAFELLRFCKHKILGNSTFSWWAAFLAGNIGMVYCPKFWLGWKQNENLEYRYPKEWIQVS